MHTVFQVYIYKSMDHVIYGWANALFPKSLDQLTQMFQYGLKELPAQRFVWIRNQERNLKDGL